MEDSQTPTLPEFRIDVATPHSMNTCRVNAGIWGRCSTPIKCKHMNSPGLSPIVTRNQNHRRSLFSPKIMSPRSTHYHLKKLSIANTLIEKSSEDCYLTPSSCLATHSFSESNFGNSTFTGIPPCEEDKGYSFLNQTLSVSLILSLLDLENYSERFTNAGIDLTHFMKLKRQDMLQLGIPSNDDCERIEKLLEDLNISEKV